MQSELVISGALFVYTVDLLMLDLDDDQDSYTGHVVDKRSVGGRILIIYGALKKYRI